MAFLEGQLVNLRPIEREDLPTLKEWMNDRETTRLLGGARFPPSIAEQERWYAEVLDNKEGRIFAIATKDGVLIGDVGLRHMGGRAHNGELGIVLGNKDYWGKGYGTDAILTLLDYAFRDMNLDCVYLGTAEHNKRAFRCYEKCGFKFEGRLRRRFFSAGRYWDMLSMSILREEFEAQYPQMT